MKTVSLDHIIISLRHLGGFVLINGIIALGITAFFCTQCFLQTELWGRGLYFWLYSFLISSVLSGGIGRLDQKLNQRWPWFKAPLVRLILELLMITAYSIIAVYIVVFVFHWVQGHFTLQTIPWKNILEQVWSPVYIAYIITFFFTSRSFLMEWRQAAVDAEKLRTERYAGQYQILKDQLNPHFLFNSLNVLSNIVYEDQEKAVDYIQQLSRFYRYVLEVQQEEVVPLEQELNFVQRYLYLQKLRFGDNLKVEVPLKALPGEQIPPLALQLCIENAIKHNEISSESPLSITISRDADQVVVENTLQLKTQPAREKSTGVGLTNIRERYRLLSEKKISLSGGGTTFRVSLPILTLNDKVGV